MKTLQDVRRQLATGKFEFSRHAFRRVVERNISEQEIREAGTDAEPIEDYPEDKYTPSALLLGFTAGGATPAAAIFSQAQSLSNNNYLLFIVSRSWPAVVPRVRDEGGYDA
jgi:Domain of unknown function (DUF4258)